MSAAAPRPPPARAVWELTWRCNLRCEHCLVEGGPNPKQELDPEASLALVAALADLGVRRVTLTGGEPLMRRDWARIAQEIVARGMALVLSSNGLALSGERLATAAALGTAMVILSLDGLRETHDRRRRYPEARAARSSFDETLAALARIRAAGVPVGVITTVDAENLAELPALHRLVEAAGAARWDVQLGHATGRLGREAMLPPARLPELAAFLVAASRHPRLPPMVHHSIGWLSRDEPTLRSSGGAGRARFWRGSPCGQAVLAIEPDGGVKGCPNQVGAPFVVGNVRTEPLAEIWQDEARWFWLQPPLETAGGPCAPCGLKAICRGGCPCVSWASSGQLFNNPHCLRAVQREQA